MLLFSLFAGGFDCDYLWVLRVVWCCVRWYLCLDICAGW